MPVISYFFGISIRMYHDDHPPPHFHAEYQGFEAYVAIESGEIIMGKLPKRAKQLVQEWALVHRDELEANWLKAQAILPLDRIAGADYDENR